MHNILLSVTDRETLLFFIIVSRKYFCIYGNSSTFLIIIQLFDYYIIIFTVFLRFLFICHTRWVRFHATNNDWLLSFAKFSGNPSAGAFYRSTVQKKLYLQILSERQSDQPFSCEFCKIFVYEKHLWATVSTLWNTAIFCNWVLTYWPFLDQLTITGSTKNCIHRRECYVKNGLQ